MMITPAYLKHHAGNIEICKTGITVIPAGIAGIQSTGMR